MNVHTSSHAARLSASARFAAVGLHQQLNCRASLLEVVDTCGDLGLERPAVHAAARPEYKKAVFEHSKLAHEREQLRFGTCFSHWAGVPQKGKRQTTASRRGWLVACGAVQEPHGRYTALRVLDARLLDPLDGPAGAWQRELVADQVLDVTGERLGRAPLGDRRIQECKGGHRERMAWLGPALRGDSPSSPSVLTYSEHLTDDRYRSDDRENNDEDYQPADEFGPPCSGPRRGR
jgi:hypothetical protein